MLAMSSAAIAPTRFVIPKSETPAQYNRAGAQDVEKHNTFANITDYASLTPSWRHTQTTTALN
jgi:hypothetical protein